MRESGQTRHRVRRDAQGRSVNDVVLAEGVYEALLAAARDGLRYMVYFYDLVNHEKWDDDEVTPEEVEAGVDRLIQEFLSNH